MEQQAFGMGIEIWDNLVVSILILFGILETIAGNLKRSHRSWSDWIQEVGSFFALASLIKPAIVLTIVVLGNALFPAYMNVLTDMNWGFVLLGYLLVDDCLQYWYHRSAHEYNFLWKLHRAHHQAEEMGFFVSYRNAALYYIMMPNLWWGGLVTFMGGGLAVVVGLVLKQIVIIGSHSTLPWDKPLYRIRFLQPLMYVLERIIITPAFHHAHHGKSKLDGISDPNGNFGNMFSIWDQLFGTAVYTQRFPSDYGLPNDPKEHWTASYFYPAVQAKDKHSELSRGYVKTRTATNEPIWVELKKDEPYLWCQCGLSKNQPYCDGSHHGTKHTPVRFVAQRDGKAKLCNCKISKTSPFCDNSHESL